MRILFALVPAAFLIWTLDSCNSSSGPAVFCDSCLHDSLRFTGNHPLQPTVLISAKDCLPDSISWSYEGMEVNRKTSFNYLMGTTVHLNKDFTNCFIIDTAFAWLVFNDCATGRGFQAKLPFSKKEKFSLRSSGINSFDKKYSVANGLLAYSDRGNIMVEEIATGKSATMTFGQRVEIDYDAIHESLDSVNVTPTRIWARVKIDNEWKELEKNIELK